MHPIYGSFFVARAESSSRLLAASGQVVQMLMTFPASFATDLFGTTKAPPWRLETRRGGQMGQMGHGCVTSTGLGFGRFERSP